MTPKVAVVTGAGSGIGRYTAIGLMDNGYRVVLAGRRSEPLEETRYMTRHSSGGMVIPTDVTDERAVELLFKGAIEGYGRVDVVFNNAGTFAGTGPLEDLPAAKWRDIIDVNLTGAFLCARAAFRCMKAQAPKGGRIINNGSISAHVPRPHAVAYTASKHAVTGLTKAISLEGRTHGIACGQIDIGNAATDMTKTMKTGMLQADGVIREEPTMDPQHVVDAVLYMAGLPLEANVQFLTVTATAMPFIGRG